MSEQPSSWKDLRPDEVEAIMQIARLPSEQRAAMLQAGKNILFWRALSERITGLRLLILAVGGIVAYVFGLFDFLLDLADKVRGQ